MPKSIWGPIKWAELHFRAASDLPMDGEPLWFSCYVKGLPCPSCRDHFDGFLRENPPDFSSRGAFFAWTVEAHNAVNERCRKGRVSIEDARRLYRWPTES